MLGDVGGESESWASAGIAYILIKEHRVEMYRHYLSSVLIFFN